MDVVEMPFRPGVLVYLGITELFFPPCRGCLTKVTLTPFYTNTSQHIRTYTASESLSLSLSRISKYRSAKLCYPPSFIFDPQNDTYPSICLGEREKDDGSKALRPFHHLKNRESKRVGRPAMMLKVPSRRVSRRTFFRIFLFAPFFAFFSSFKNFFFFFNSHSKARDRAPAKGNREMAISGFRSGLSSFVLLCIELE